MASYAENVSIWWRHHGNASKQASTESQFYNHKSMTMVITSLLPSKRRRFDEIMTLIFRHVSTGQAHRRVHLTAKYWWNWCFMYWYGNFIWNINWEIHIFQNPWLILVHCNTWIDIYIYIYLVIYEISLYHHILLQVCPESRYWRNQASRMVMFQRINYIMIYLWFIWYRYIPVNWSFTFRKKVIAQECCHEMMQTLSSLTTPEVVITTPAAASDNKELWYHDILWFWCSCACYITPFHHFTKIVEASLKKGPIHIFFKSFMIVDYLPFKCRAGKYIWNISSHI